MMDYSLEKNIIFYELNNEFRLWEGGVGFEIFRKGSPSEEGILVIIQYILIFSRIIRRGVQL